VPLRAPTLPPAAHTNSYVVGDRRLAIIDPGSGDEGELAKLFSIVGAMEEEDRRVTQIWLTHHHGDHIGGLAACAARWNVPVLAHPLTAEVRKHRIPRRPRPRRSARPESHLPLRRCRFPREASHGAGCW